MNDSKTEYIVAGSLQQLSKLKCDIIRVGNESIKSADSVKYLGLWMDFLKFSTRIKNKCIVRKICKT